jgi:hypothetical protein
MWLSFIIRNYKLFGVLTLIGCLILSFGYIRYQKYQLTTTRATVSVLQANLKEVERNYNVSKNYQSELIKLRANLDRLRNSPPKCIIPNGGHNDTTTRNKLSGRDGISTGWLFDYAGRAEEVRLRLIACQQQLGD